MDIAERLFNWFVASTLMASAVAVVVLAVQHLLRRRIHARLRYALWLIVLLRLMLPVLPQSPVSLFNAVPAWTDIKNAVLGVSYQWNKPDAISEHSQIENTYQPYYTTNEAEKNTVLQPLLTTDTEEHITAGIEGESHPAVRVLAVVWLTGAAVLLGYNLIYWLRFQNKLKRLSPVDRASILKIAEECRSLFSMKRPVGIYVDPSAQSPYITGIFRPAVYLPKSLVSETVNEQLLKHVIAHELAHYKRKDTIWNMVGSLVFAVHWMNPFVWFVLRQIKADRELACDALVLEKLGEEEAVPYGMTIIEFLRRYASGRSPAHLLYFRGSNGQREMIRRIQMIQSFKKGSYKFTMMAVALVLLVGTATLTNARTSEAGASAPGAEVAQEQKQSEEKMVEFQIDKKLAAKLQSAMKQFAGKEIKLRDVGEITTDSHAEVKSVDGKYMISFHPKTGEIWYGSTTLSIDEVSKEDQNAVLKQLKELYPNKTYILGEKAGMSLGFYDEKKAEFMSTSYSFKGENFSISLNKQQNTKNQFPSFMIKIDVKELEPKWMKAATEAVKTALNHDFKELTEARLTNGGYDYNNRLPIPMWVLESNDVLVELDTKSGKALNVIDKSRTKGKVTTGKEIAAKDVQEVIAPLAKQLFDIDITGYEVKWDDRTKDYRFAKDYKDEKGNEVEKTIVRAALDADKKVAYLLSSGRAATGSLY